MEMRLEYVKCNLCGNDKCDILYKKPDTRFHISDIMFNVVKCTSCGLAFVNPRPTPEKMELFYPKEYYEKRGIEYERYRYEREAEFLESMKPGRVLDIGCANGGFLKILEERGWDVFGMDYLNRGENPYGLDIRYGDLKDIRYPSNYFDVITAWAVFEHLHNPMVYFKEVARILKPSGHFVFLVTNINSIWSRYAYCEDIPRHLYFYSRRTLSEYAKKINFKIINVDHSNKIFRASSKNVFRTNFLRWAGVPWGELYKSQRQMHLKVIERLSSILGNLLIKPTLESSLRIAGIIVVTMKKPPVISSNI